MLDKFLKIGFEDCKVSKDTTVGWCREYKYKPSYFIGKIYTLVTFTYGKVDVINKDTEYRLYIHDELTGAYIDSIFQATYDGNTSFLDKKFDETFSSEIRDRKLSELLC